MVEIDTCDKLPGNRQLLNIPHEFEEFDFVKDSIKLWDLFANDLTNVTAQHITVPECCLPVIESMEIGSNQKFNIRMSKDFVTHNYVINKTEKSVCVCISGGKDSLAAALKYIDDGYTVYLFTCRGINKGYPEEYLSAVELADKLNLPIYVCQVNLVGKKHFMEHPLKNQIICSLAVAWCLKNNHPPKIVFGDYKEEDNSKSNWGYNWCDNYDLWQAYSSFLREYVPEFEILIPFETEQQGVEMIMSHKDLIPFIQSCMLGVRYRKQLHEKNQVKFGVTIWKNRCGSCIKCCTEYINCVDYGIMEYNKDFYKHCLNIIRLKYGEFTDGNQHAFDNYAQLYDQYFEREHSRSKFFTS